MRSVWSLTCHCQDTGASGRGVSFTLGGALPSGVKARPEVDAQPLREQPRLRRQALSPRGSSHARRSARRGATLSSEGRSPEGRRPETGGGRFSQTERASFLTWTSTATCRSPGRLLRLRRDGVELSWLCATVRCWCPVVRRVVLDGALAEVSPWNAPSWCSRSWCAAFHCARR